MHDFNRKVLDYFQLDKTDGDIGIEIEMETLVPNVPMGQLENMWRFEHDGSLRGNGLEMVLRRPIKANHVGSVIQDLKDKFEQGNVNINNSVRAGIHVHVNMQKHTIKDVLHFLLCYYPMETVLTRFCGQTRSGNLFCLRVRDAEFILECLKQAIEKDDIYVLRTNALRYSALNVQSLFSYGSVEFRALATTPNLEKIEEWCDILMRIKDYALKVEDPWENLSKISGMGPRQWMVDIIGEEYTNMLEYQGMENDIMKDARQLQYVCSILNMKGI